MLAVAATANTTRFGVTIADNWVTAPHTGFYPLHGKIVTSQVINSVAEGLRSLLGLGQFLGFHAFFLFGYARSYYTKKLPLSSP
jgi:hypothetical protein